MSKPIYEKELQRLNIEPSSAPDGLPIVFDKQSLLEIFHQSPEQCTAMFERHCGSILFKIETDIVKGQLEVAAEQFNHINKMTLALLKKHKAMQKMAKEYADLKQEMVSLFCEANRRKIYVCYVFMSF